MPVIGWRGDEVLAQDALNPHDADARAAFVAMLPEPDRTGGAAVLAELAVALAQHEATPAEDATPSRWPALEAWPEPVEGPALGEALVAAYRRFVIMMRPSDYDAAALWAIFAHAHDVFEFSPLLLATSAERACAKTRLLEVLTELVPRPYKVDHPSDAVVYRIIDQDHPTLMVDEGDTVRWPDRIELAGIVNGGFSRRGSVVPRCVGEGANLEVRDFSVWSPKAIAGKGLVAALPDTTISRAIVVELRRKLRTERVEPFRAARAHVQLLPLARQAARWARDHAEALNEAEPVMPEELSDRAADAWSPLIAIADALGDSWPERGRRAAVALATGTAGTLGTGELLLKHIRESFGEEDPVFSAGLVDRLKRIEGAEELARDQIAQLIAARFKGHGLTRLVEAVLDAQGYTTYRSPEGADGGVDIIAGAGPLGFGSPRLCVEVKSEALPIDRPTVDKLLGAVTKFGADEGLFVSWSGFKGNVQRELAASFFRVRLWTRKDLLEELFDHYDDLDDDLKAELPLKRVWMAAQEED